MCRNGVCSTNLQGEISVVFMHVLLVCMYISTYITSSGCEVEVSWVVSGILPLVLLPPTPPVYFLSAC
jgi:hypothetical protein